jgi:2-dehydropantoate 2-reductase
VVILEVIKSYEGSDQLKLFYSPSGYAKKIAKRFIIINDANKTKVYPKLVSNDPDNRKDLLFCATKTYDIEESLLSIQNVSKKSFTYYPYNGVDAKN